MLYAAQTDIIMLLPEIKLCFISCWKDKCIDYKMMERRHANDIDVKLVDMWNKNRKATIQ